MWQWKYVKAFIDGIRYDEKDLAKKNVASAEKTISDIDSQISVPLRELTQEEKDKIASGELSRTEAMAQIVAEAVGTASPSAGNTDEAAQSDGGGEAASSGENASAQGQEGSTASGQQSQEQSGNASTSRGGQGTEGQSGQTKPSEQSAATQSKPSQSSDAIIANAVSELYALQSQYTAGLEGLVGRVKVYYNQQKKENPSSARSNTIAHFSGEVASMESECDSKVENLLKRLTNQLNEIGADTSVVSTLRSAYEDEKSSQMAAYVKKYASK